MLVLIIGGSGSGKSSYAEDYVIKLSKSAKKYYIATMQIYGKKGLKKVERHRKMREGKDFFTIEQPTKIQNAIEKMIKDSNSECIVLLECMSNLAANEMFCEEGIQSCEVVTERILCGIESLRKAVKDIVIVTNTVFEDGIIYDETTKEYLKALGYINQELAKAADKVIEVVVGIPVILK